MARLAGPPTHRACACEAVLFDSGPMYRSADSGRSLGKRALRTTRQHRAAGSVSRPIGPPLIVGVGARLIVVWPAQHVEYLGDACGITLLSAIDDLLREVVAEHVARICAIHARLSLRRRHAVASDPGRVSITPRKECRFGSAHLHIVVEGVSNRVEPRSVAIEIGEA